MLDWYNKGIYFISDSTTFSYAATCLADGLNQMGVPIFANISYCDPLISDFVFTKISDMSSVRQASCVVLDLQDTRQYYEQTVRFNSPYSCTIAFCMQDDVGNFCADGVDVLYCAHENRFRELAGRRIPMAFGLSSAMIRKSMTLQKCQPRLEKILYNFRPSLNQDLRSSLDLVLLPVLNRHIPVLCKYSSAGRWNDDYYELLRSHAICLAYGGNYEQDFTKNEYFMGNERFRLFSANVKHIQETVILRWDSWRFWESLVFGCVTVHLDFERYGFLLPEMPENWKHYVGINLSDVKADVERLMDERDRWPEIAWQGRQWAIKHYSPLAVGRRFISVLSNLQSLGTP